MIVRAVQNLSPGTLVSPPSGYAGSLGIFDPEHGPNMRIAEYNGMLTGLVGFGPSWSPWAAASRGETAPMLWNLMELLDRLTSDRETVPRCDGAKPAVAGFASSPSPGLLVDRRQPHDVVEEDGGKDHQHQ